MPLNAAALDVAGDALAAAITHVSIHTAAPDASGSNLSAAGKVAATPTSVNGLLTWSNIAFTGGAASGAVHSFGFWGGAGQTTFYGYQPRETGDATFNAAGEYTATSITLTGSASD